MQWVEARKAVECPGVHGEAAPAGIGPMPAALVAEPCAVH